MVKTVNLLRQLSIILFLIVFVLVYAYMPVMVTLSPDGHFEIHKESFFYYGAGSFLIINIITRIITNFFLTRLISWKGEETASWFLALPLIINIYLIFIAGFLGVLNNPVHILAGSYSYLNFLGPTLFLLWVLGLIYFSISKK